MSFWVFVAQIDFYADKKLVTCWVFVVQISFYADKKLVTHWAFVVQISFYTDKKLSLLLNEGYFFEQNEKIIYYTTFSASIKIKILPILRS